ncbi:MAG: Rpn family recombination-promoting nuclease/putative transposase [Oliverpabstia sp.]
MINLFKINCFGEIAVFLCGLLSEKSCFSVEDLLKPVVIVVIFFGDVKWKGARTLHELLDWTDIPEEWKELFMDYRMYLIEVQKIESRELSHSDLKLLFGLLQSKNNKEKLKGFSTKIMMNCQKCH